MNFRNILKKGLTIHFVEHYDEVFNIAFPELSRYMRNPHAITWSSTLSSSKIIQPEDLAIRSAEIRQAGKTIATLNGSFDLMHAGHLHIIYEASQMADVLDRRLE